MTNILIYIRKFLIYDEAIAVWWGYVVGTRLCCVRVYILLNLIVFTGWSTMPIDGRVFYRKNSNSSSESSKLRWPRKNGYSSSLVIPPTEMSEPLSAPTSGCSSAKGSVNTSPAKSERFLKPSKLDTDKLSGSLTTSRFARYLTKQQDQGHHGRTNPTTAKEVLSKAVGKEPVPASSYLRDAVGPPNPLEKCKLWIEKGCSKYFYMLIQSM